MFVRAVLLCMRRYWYSTQGANCDVELVCGLQAFCNGLGAVVRGINTGSGSSRRQFGRGVACIHAAVLGATRIA